MPGDGSEEQSDRHSVTAYRPEMLLGDREEEAIADSHISIIRLSDLLNKYYIIHFMRSILGRAQIEVLEIFVKGPPEIYPDQLERFQIIDIPQSKSMDIIDSIEK